jgi:hypothetical protein
MAFWLLGTYVSYLNCIFNILKNVKKKNQTKMLCVHLDVLSVHEVFLREKTTFLCGLCKSDKIGIKIDIFAPHFFSFLHGPQNVCFS